MARRRDPLIIRTIIALNLLVFVGWQVGSLREFMVENFLLSWSHLEAGYYWTLVTSVFSHSSFLHFFVNMFVLSSFGSLLFFVLGARPFLTLYFTAGFVSSVAHVLTSHYWMHEDVAALGASGAISALILLFALLFPREKIVLFGLIPVPALVGALAFVALDIWGLTAQAKGGGLPIGHGAHLGGAATGLVYYFLRGRAIRQRLAVDI